MSPRVSNPAKVPPTRPRHPPLSQQAYIRTIDVRAKLSVVVWVARMVLQRRRRRVAQYLFEHGSKIVKSCISFMYIFRRIETKLAKSHSFNA